MAKILLTSDWHLTDKPRDAYRFKFLSWLGEFMEKEGVDAVCMLGDLTDSKDRHSGKFITQVTSALCRLAAICPLVILRGNHDCLDPAYPTFGFLDRLPNMYFVQGAQLLEFGVGREATQVFLTAHRRGDVDWADLIHQNGLLEQLIPPSLFLIHQTLAGAVASNGFKLEGIDPKSFGGKHPFQIFSGDIHVPQTLGRVTYVGSPYHIHFGDTFAPRLLLWTPRKITSVEWKEGPSRHVWTVTDPNNLRTMKSKKGDQVKVRLSLPRSLYADWAQYQQAVEEECEQLGVELIGVSLVPQEPGKGGSIEKKASDLPSLSPKDIVTDFAKRENLDRPTTQIGKQLVVEG